MGGLHRIADANTVQLNNAYPNPANNPVTLSYYLPKESTILLQLYTAEGRLLKTVSEGMQQSGIHKVEVPLRDVAQGVYFYRLATEDQNLQKKLIVLH